MHFETGINIYHIKKRSSNLILPNDTLDDETENLRRLVPDRCDGRLYHMSIFLRSLLSVNQFVTFSTVANWLIVVCPTTFETKTSHNCCLAVGILTSLHIQILLIVASCLLVGIKYRILIFFRHLFSPLSILIENISCA